jgi:uncharacterized phage protein (TIGR02216 family)
MQLTPDVFWALSLPEWRALLDGRAGARAQPLARGEMEHLMRMHPDG